ncbi:hypothetical protein BGZ95_000091 [Linnemannia exigua]|uniref:C2H2-type domain-containing protein n=1 Tax=Linnemannia exigua TaxID=604196 RepID=A0AAD4DAV3_9FUNG|nr:hypothetical protein BGZ95_000091 [Linnemannia exigua]
MVSSAPISEVPPAQNGMMAQSRQETPVIPSQQPMIPPRGMHRHQLSFDGHVAAPVDLQLLNAQMQQRQQHQQQQDMMAAAVMVSVQQGVLTPVDSSIANILVPTMTPVHPVSNMQDLAAMSAPTVSPHLMSGVSQQQQHQQAIQQAGLPMQIKIEPGLVSHPSIRSAGPNTPSEMGYPTPLASAEALNAFTPMVPSMQPHPASATTTPAFTPPEGVIASLTDPSKRHRRHPSSGHHSPELRIVFQKQDFLQQQQQKMAVKEQILYENTRRVEVEPHQTRSPRAAAAAGLKINVSDIQPRAVSQMSAVVSPNESGRIYSPGPLSGPSPTMGPIPNSLMDTIMEVSSNLQLQNLDDTKSTIKTESMEVLEPPSTRSELAELSKQELIEKVMEYERQMEGSLPARRMSNAKSETGPSDNTLEMPAIPHPISSPQQQPQQPPILTFSPTPSIVSLSGSLAPGTSETPQSTLPDRKSASPQLAVKTVTSPVTQNDDDDDEDEGDDEEDEEDMEDDDNEDDAEGDNKTSTRAAKPRNIPSGTAADDTEPPLQLVCLWRDCNTPFETMEQLNEHVTENHIGSGKACYSCDWQGCHRQQKPFTKRHKMYNHLRTHTGERPFKCLVPGCDKKFSRPDSLTTHTKTHSNHRPYSCPMEGCSKAYYHARSLKKHELAHETKRGGHHRALRGPGSNATAQSSSGDASNSSTATVSTSAAAPPQQQQQYSHYNHPYHPDFTSGSGRATKHHGHQRQLSQSTGFNLALTSDPAVVTGMLSAGSVSSGTNSPSPGGMGTGLGFNPGFNPSMTIIKPSLSNHSSTSSVPSLSLVMSNASLGSIDGQQTPMSANPAFHHQQHPQSHAQGVHVVSMPSANTSHQTTPAGSPGFQSAAVPSSILTSPPPPPPGINTSVPLTVPMSMGMPMPMDMGMSMNGVDLQGVSSPPAPMPVMPVMPAMPPAALHLNMVHPQGGLEAMTPTAANGNTLYTIMPTGPMGAVVPSPAGMMSGIEVPVSSAPGTHLSLAGSEPGPNGHSVPMVPHPM